MKSLTIQATGQISYVFNDIEGVTDVSHPDLSAADARLFQDEIDKMMANNFQELHIEKSSINSFVHKVGAGSFMSDKNPDDYEVFRNMHQWAPAVHHG